MSDDHDIIIAAGRWYDARAAFLHLSPGSAEAQHRLNDLAEAENNLFAAVAGLKKLVADFHKRTNERTRQ